MNKKLTLNSRVKEVYKNPIGHDIIYKLLLQMNKSEKLITNPVMGSLKLKTLKRLTKNQLDEGFYNTFLRLLNSEEEVPRNSCDVIQEKWWKEAVFYQIYPRSFKDSNGDGIGDLRGIIEKLDYLKSLGVDVIWLCPIYDSPNDDNGYDIRDYYKIMEEFGTMEDFEDMLKQVHARGMKLIMDLVVNHTSDEHKWFQEALSQEDSKYEEYYKFVASSDGNPPNNWTSFFSGSAWNYYEHKDKWALHLFSKKQIDLNWDNEDLRKDIYKMINWWLGRGVDGFRLDVINYISKEAGLPKGNEAIGKLMGFYGVESYFYGPNLHKYLKEMREETFDKYGAFTVGETPGVGMEMSKLLTADYRKELDMVFSFDDLETPGHVRFDVYNYDLNYLKEYMIDWMENYGNNCWMSLFYENHDNPRMISKVNNEPKYRLTIGKLLAVLQFTLKGTPFIFQGQELGLINKNFRSIEDFKDIESINKYEELLKEMDKDSALRKILAGSRDNSRTPMQWNSDINGGFSEGKPWIGNDEDYKKFNVEAELQDRDSIFHFYKKLIFIRKENKALIYGDFKVVNPKKKDIFTYYRELEGRRFYIECNLSNKEIKRCTQVTHYQLILSNYEKESHVLRPYEANIYLT
ncbi:MAG: alpha-glucosidase [Clostridium sp.]